LDQFDVKTCTSWRFKMSNYLNGWNSCSITGELYPANLDMMGFCEVSCTGNATSMFLKGP